MAQKEDKMKLLKNIYSWILGIDLNRDGVADAEQIKKAHEELKERVRRVKEESEDVVKAVKEVKKQSKDVIDAAAGKKRRGRPKKK